MLRRYRRGLVNSLFEYLIMDNVRKDEMSAATTSSLRSVWIFKCCSVRDRYTP